MAVIQRDHLSREVGHTSGICRVLLASGLVLVALGVVGFAAGVLVGLADARDGVVTGDGSVWLLPVGGAAVSVGLVVSSVAMAWGRRAAGE